MKAIQNEIIEEIKEEGYEVTTDAEEIYWREIYKDSIANKRKKDIRTRGVCKPIIVENKEETIVIEKDYTNKGWIAWKKDGEIISEKKSKTHTIGTVKRRIKYGW